MLSDHNKASKSMENTGVEGNIVFTSVSPLKPVDYSIEMTAEQANAIASILGLNADLVSELVLTPFNARVIGIEARDV